MKNDFQRNDEVHEQLDTFGSEFRVARSIDAMREESYMLRTLFQEHVPKPV
jgi:hypothetical protein